MNNKQLISRLTLADFTKSRKLADMSIYDEDCLDDEGKVISLSDQLAIVTHYMQSNAKNKVIFEKKARTFMKLWLKWELDEDISNDYVFNDCCDSLSQNLFFTNKNVPFPHKENPDFQFIDLFAGIGGFRLAMQSCGGECVYSSEWDANAQKTYYFNFGEFPFGDITKESNKKMIPDGFDVLCAGFPCQAFSIAGYRKGFEDTRGTLFFDVADIISRKNPKAVFLENVKNLYSHDSGKTFKVIKQTLEDLGYVVYHKVMNAMEYADTPQNRERIFIVCFDPKQVPNHNEFTFPDKVELTKNIGDCIDYNIDDKRLYYTNTFPHYDQLSKEVVSKETIYQWRRQYVRENKSNVCPTLTANMGTGGHNVPIILTEKGIRKLSPKECINFQGYPKSYFFPNNIAESAKYKQAGNSVVVPLIEKICKNLISTIYPNL